MSDRQEGLLAGNDILTENGYISIGELKEKDKVICAGGWGQVAVSKIKKIKKEKYKGQVVEFLVEGKKKIRMLPKQVCFSKFDFTGNAYYIVLIYRQQKGWRIGLETDMRGLNKQNLNYDDKFWVLDILQDEMEAIYFQHLYSYRFGIPMVNFESKNDKFNFNQDFIDKIFTIIDTEERAEQVFDELSMYRDYPYYIAPNKQFGTKLLTIIMFGNKERAPEDEWHLHRIYVNVDHNKISYGKTSIIDPASKSAWNINTIRKDYDELNNFANVLAGFEELEIIRRSQLTSQSPFFYFPATHLKKTMLLPVYNKKEKKIDEKRIENVSMGEYEGEVYSIEVENLRNLVANDILVYS
ncbi:MAG: hypothetical protein WC002_05910 [Candidatus Muiribacteriota bacterium]|jgi:DNA helicase-2/ATP-dependent DNA helicase PcrA